MTRSAFDNVEEHLGPWGEYTTNFDVCIGTLTWGWNLGFAYFVVCHIIRQQKRVMKMNMYLVMLWGEFITTMAFSAASWLRFIGAISPLYIIRLAFLVSWIIQLHLLFQIIINRICILLSERNYRLWLKYGTAAFVAAINISGLSFWLPESHKPSGDFIYVEMPLNRIEKITYLVVDTGLNLFFIHLVNSKLENYGFSRFKPLVKFNLLIVIISVILDIVLAVMMWFPADFLYFQFLPVTNLIKLNIEMSLGDLIVTLSKEPIYDPTLTKEDPACKLFTPIELSSIELSHQTTTRSTSIEYPL